MTAGKAGFRAIIAGGGISGLCLANMFERLGIDYVLLEAYGEAAPQVGASIGLLPNSLRILDQLGCYDDIRALTEEPSQTAYARGPDGNKLMTLSNLSLHMIKRHGYPILFVDRQMVLRVLYDHLEDKSKVLLNKKVTKVALSAERVEATVADGSSYVGDILVGADGVHSFVRREMWRISDEVSPGPVPHSEYKAMPCDYGCIFGISRPIEGIDFQNIHTVFNKDHSHLVIAGPGARVYFFLFFKLNRTYGPNIPRFTKDDEEELARKHQDDPITETVRFRDIYNHRTVSVLTALPEYVLERWHFGRIMTIGDAAHKFEPLSGQGGNNAIETAAALTNALQSALDSHPQGLNDKDMSFVFEQTKNLRAPRCTQLVNEAHLQQRIEAMENGFFGWLACRIIPKLHLETHLRRWTDPAVASVRLNGLAVPKRSRFVPYDDELPYPPLRGKCVSTFAMASLFAALVWTQTAGLPLLDQLLAQCCILHAESPARVFSGLDRFTAAISTPHWSMFLPVYVIWTVEGYRNGSSRTLVSFPSLWAMASYFLGLGIVAPLHCFVSVFATSNDTYARTSGRPLPVAAARAVLVSSLAVCITAAMPLLLGQWHVDVPGPALALIPQVPLLVPLLTLLPHLLPCHHQDSALDMYEGNDTPLLRVVYLISFLTAAAAHLCVAFQSWPSPDVLSGAYAVPSHDSIAGLAAICCWCFYSIYEVRRLGYASTPQALRAACVLVAGQVLVGPGAAYAGVWYWREETVARLSIGSGQM
ncbi:fad binding domain-containing protein [Diplodia corticola]|uniref:Fad binding domain-containing protein n=1 Tax=Diplodia corticola TaxID=236234 RepID=A0A1J9RR72_9PEZI|nr:fad binding domain-containing protein [Diplodia corticola]OJD30037.1 fad binding domain-containing protein [Diplodia corticola]